LTGGAGFCVGLTGAAVGAAARVGAGVVLRVVMGVGVGVADAVGSWLADGAPPPTPPDVEVRLVGRALVVGVSEQADSETTRTATMPKPTATAPWLVERNAGTPQL